MNDLASIASTDIYLIDQILKGRYQPGQRILDAGAGHGRNLRWFFQQDFDVFAFDLEADRKAIIEEEFPKAKFDWKSGDIAALPYLDNHFDHVLCMAVLHFARNKKHMAQMWRELARVLKPEGSMLIRTCMLEGLEKRAESLGDNRFYLPDDSERYLLSLAEIAELMTTNGLERLEPIKWLNVENLRVMGTLVVRKVDS